MQKTTNNKWISPVKWKLSIWFLLSFRRLLPGRFGSSPSAKYSTSDIAIENPGYMTANISVTDDSRLVPSYSLSCLIFFLFQIDKKLFRCLSACAHYCILINCQIQHARRSIISLCIFYSILGMWLYSLFCCKTEFFIPEPSKNVDPSYQTDLCIGIIWGKPF